MDHRIYGRLPRTDLGVYGTRRYPKGALIPGTPGVDMSLPENRNPTPIFLRFGVSAVAGHPETTRWTYTVPTKRQAVLIAAECEMARVTAGAGTVQNFIAIFLNRKEAPTDAQCEIARVTNHSDTVNALGDRAVYPGAPITLFDGDRLFCISASGNGTIDFVGAAHVLEYDEEIRAAGGGQFVNIDFNAAPGPNTLGGGGSGVLIPRASSGGSSYIGPGAGHTAYSEQVRLAGQGIYYTTPER